MKTKKSIIALIPLTIILFVAGVFVPNAGAQTENVASTTKTAKQLASEKKLMVKIIDRANKEIDRRVTALDALAARVQEMKKVSDNEKATIASDVQSQNSILVSLKAKIAADTDIETMRADVKSITGTYRVFALIIPRGHIVASADKINTVADLFTAIVTKLEAKIVVAKSAGNDVAVLESTLADMKAKIADAKVQAQNADAKVAPLTPDQGDTAKLQANKTALSQARTSIKVGNDDLKKARQDATLIVKELKAFKVNTATTTPASVQ
ncbi:MAG: hypothetical protein WCW87_02935 [Candidatus Paceibacterota bacterium]